MKVMQDIGKAGQAEGSIYGKLGMYAFFIFFTIAVISLVAARMTKRSKNEYVDDKGVEHVAAALPQTEEEPVTEGSLYSSQQLIQKLTPKIEKDVELLKKEFPNYNIDLVKNRYESDGSYTLSISGKNTSTADNNKLQKVIKSKIKESVTEALVKGKTYGGSKCEGGCFVGKTGLMKIIKISKESPKDVFMFRDDNYSGLQPHFIKNGVIAKATVINPSYDLEKHKVRNLKIGNDVILSVRLFVSTNESVNESNDCGCN